MQSYKNDEIALILDENYAQLHSKERETVLREALEKFFGKSLQLIIRVGPPQAETPAQQRLRLQDARQQAALEAIYNDPNVKALEERLNARVKPGSIRPKA